VVGGGVGWVRVVGGACVVVVVGFPGGGFTGTVPRVVVVPRRVVVVVVLVVVVVTVVVDAFVVLAEVVVTVLVGSRTTGESLLSDVLMTGAAGPGLAGGVAFVVAVSVATVASTVAMATPEPARMTSARDLARLSAGGAIYPLSVESVTELSLALSVMIPVQSALSDVDHHPKSWVQSQPWVSRPIPMALKPQFRMFARWSGEFIQSVMTCCALVWPCAMFSPPGLG
jgi:hypothetical protein